MIIPIITILLLVAVDQITKLAVVKWLMPVGSREIINGFFSLTYVENRGAAFGTLQGAGWLFVFITVVVLIGGAFYYRKLQIKGGSAVTKIALLLVGGGAIGNCIDRLLRGYVVDMLDFNLFGWDFPVFNFADICVCIGAFLIIVFVGFLGKSEDKK